ncbi:hypothetical protein SAMN04487950_4431 [Halogranum rubrum]|uniref:Uncharacterized protein n=1 Tax=Halogranum rubrum TaxID=553466 RepID=A0A1I4JB37_9EURY|nr:hypothetical protein SAMN04487950_4431 [Halogranum rubrum]
MPALISLVYCRSAFFKRSLGITLKLVREGISNDYIDLQNFVFNHFRNYFLFRKRPYINHNTMVFNGGVSR